MKIKKYFGIGTIVWIIATAITIICASFEMNLKDLFKSMTKNSKIILVLSLPIYIVTWPIMLLIIIYRIIREIICFISKSKNEKEEDPE